MNKQWVDRSTDSLSVEVTEAESHLQQNPPLKLALWVGLQIGTLCLWDRGHDNFQEWTNSVYYVCVFVCVRVCLCVRARVLRLSRPPSLLLIFYYWFFLVMSRWSAQLSMLLEVKARTMLHNLDVELSLLLTRGLAATWFNPISTPNNKLTPSLPQPVAFPGWKTHGRAACKEYIFRSYNTSTLNAKHFDENPFTCQCEKEDRNA